MCESTRRNWSRFKRCACACKPCSLCHTSVTLTRQFWFTHLLAALCLPHEFVSTGSQSKVLSISFLIYVYFRKNIYLPAVKGNGHDCPTWIWGPGHPASSLEPQLWRVFNLKRAEELHGEPRKQTFLSWQRNEESRALSTYNLSDLWRNHRSLMSSMSISKVL